MNLWIVGPMGSGKTTAGRLAAKVLSLDFFDTDEHIADRAGCSVAQLWGDRGESAFRHLERVIIRELAGTHGVISTGGGAPVDEANRLAMTTSGRSIWLTAAPDVLARRLGSSDERPLLAGAKDPETQIGILLRRRQSAYEAVADHRIDTDVMSPAEVAAEIVSWWEE